MRRRRIPQPNPGSSRRQGVRRSQVSKTNALVSKPTLFEIPNSTAARSMLAEDFGLGRTWKGSGGWRPRETPEDGAQIMAALSPVTDELFRQARSEGRREAPAAYSFDALVELAREAMASPSEAQGAKAADPSRERRRRRGAPVKLIVRLDHDTFLRGVPVEGETCELVGYGPISISAVNDLLESGNPFVVAVLTKAAAVVGVAHLGRRPTSHQQSALEWLYPSCAVQGCPARARLERDIESTGPRRASQCSTCSTCCARTSTT